MRQTYQHGYLRRSKRKTGADRWEFLWRECDENGFIRRRTAILGSIEEYPDEVAAQGAANVIRMRLNADLLRHSYKPILISDLLDHYIATNLLADAGWHSASSRMNYDYFFRKWIRPQWGTMTIRSVRTLAVEHWLRNLRNAKGDPMANSTKAKIRSLMSLLFNHAIRCEWLEQGRNPILLVRQSAQRRCTPAFLEVQEIQSLLSQLDREFRLMVVLAVTTGLRRSELFGLKWSDVDLTGLEISIARSVYRGTVGRCKTEASRKPVPLTHRVAADLWIWKESTPYAEPADWIFASRVHQGRLPVWPGTVLQKIIQPAAIKAGISKRVGWHTFRHTYATLLIANGENVKVVQELMRHASSHFTLQIYSQAQARTKRAAQLRLVEALLEEEPWIPPPVPTAQDESRL